MGINMLQLMAMPFGKHKGVPMDDVPAAYLDWLRGQEWLGKWPEVEAYVAKHKASIDKALAEERDGEEEG